MKIRICAILIAMLGISWSAHAQNDLSFGVRGGVGFATLTGDGVGDIDLERRIGLVAGAFLRYALTPQVSIQPEILYAMKGATFSGEVLGETADVTFAFDYVEVPLLLRFDVATGASVLPYVMAGPAVAYNTKADVKTDVAGESDVEDISELVETVDFGAALAGGVSLTSGFSIEVRYTLGISNVIADPEEDDEELKNGVLSLTAAFTFPQ